MCVCVCVYMVSVCVASHLQPLDRERMLHDAGGVCILGQR